MATRLKTVEYVFHNLESVADDTVTNFEQMTIHLPEDDKVCISVTLDFFVNDICSSVDGHVDKRNMTFQLGSNGYYAQDNEIVQAGSGESVTYYMSGDYTNYFKKYWVGTNMECDASITQIKTIRLPLGTTDGPLDTSKPGAPNAVVPILDDWLPEDSVDIKQMTVVIQGNDGTISGAQPDYALYMDIDPYDTKISNDREQGLGSCRFFRYFWNLNVGPDSPNPSVLFDTSISHDFYIWTTVANKAGHLQAWIIITYEYDESTSNTILNSLLLPMTIDGPFGNDSSDFAQEASVELNIQEPGTITKKESALFVHYGTTGIITGLNARVNSQSYTTFTDPGSTWAGGACFMIRCEDDITLARGNNTLTMNVYEQDTFDGGGDPSACWMINYTSSKYALGSGAHNHTVRKNFYMTGNVTMNEPGEMYGKSFILPEEYVFYNSIGFQTHFFAGGDPGTTILIQRHAIEGGHLWEKFYSNPGQADAELGYRPIFANNTSIFKRFTGDKSPGYTINNKRLDIRVVRNYRFWAAAAFASWKSIDCLITYHSLTSTISGTVTNYTGDGESIVIDIFRTSNNEYILSTMTEVGGDYSVKYFNDAEKVFATTRQAGVYVGRSDDFLATPDNPS